jgi:uncharacterized membrane protein
MAIPPSDPRKREHHHRLAAHSVLPLFDTLFGVALTLLAYSLPENLNTSMDADSLLRAIATYLLAGLAVIIYWYKLRRLIEISRTLLIPQLLLGMTSLLLIVLMPRLAQLVVYHGAGRGDFTHWTPSQIVNTAFLSCLLLFDGICLIYALSLLLRDHLVPDQKLRILEAVRAQTIGFVLLLVLGFLELASSAFNNEDILSIPAILVLEEWWVAHRLKMI